MNKINVILFLILIALLVIVIVYLKNLIKINNNNKKINNQLELEKETLIKETLQLKADVAAIEEQKEKDYDKLLEIEKSIANGILQKERILAEASQNYFTTIEQQYEAVNKDYDAAVERLKATYSELTDKLNSEYEQGQLRILEEADKLYKQLESLRATRRATIEAFNKEEEIKQQLDFYCLHPTAAEKADIKILDNIKPELHEPRILSMLIWSTYFQKPMTTLCNNVLGTKTITGIYKITNQINNKCYIGQSVDISKRWKEHAKCGLGIDTPQGNKLYKEMLEIGIWNFSWELLEQCPREELNEKEKYYIELYQSKDYGYNTTKGNK